MRWLPPLGFENTYAIAVRPETADSLDLTTLSDLAREGGRLVAGFTPDFIGRHDGLRGLQSEYGLQPADERALLQAVKYQALAKGEVDVIDEYATDGQLACYGFTVLVDDRGFFPPYDGAALVGPRLAEEQPAALRPSGGSCRGGSGEGLGLASAHPREVRPCRLLERLQAEFGQDSDQMIENVGLQLLVVAPRGVVRETVDLDREALGARGELPNE